MPHSTGIDFRFEIRAIRDNPQRYYIFDNDTGKYIIHTLGEVKSLANLGLLNSLQYLPPLAGVLEGAIIPDDCMDMTGYGVCNPDVTPPNPKRKRLDITVKSFLPKAIERLNLDDIFSTVFNFLPLGWTIEEIKVSSNLISITFVAEGTPALLIAPIVAALMPLLIVIGVVILGWKLFNLLTSKEETKQIIEKGKIAEMIEANKDALIGTVDGLEGLTSEQKAKLVKLILEGDVDGLLGGLGGAFTGNTFILVALIAVGGLIAFGMIKK